MNWPQYIAVAWLAFELIVGLRAEVLDREQTSGMATFGIFLRLVFVAVTVLVLHCGGFW